MAESLLSCYEVLLKSLSRKEGISVAGYFSAGGAEAFSVAPAILAQVPAGT